jgi:hypothetical protein
MPCVEPCWSKRQRYCLIFEGRVGLRFAAVVAMLYQALALLAAKAAPTVRGISFVVRLLNQSLHLPTLQRQARATQ